MEGKPGIWHKNLSKKEVSKINRNIVVFAFFLLLSFIFWYLNSMSKEIKSEFHYPVTFVNLPKGRNLAGNPPVKLSLELKGQGYSLLKNKISGARIPLVIDLSHVTFKRIPESKPTKYYILSASLMTSFKKQMGNGFEIVSVKPDTIFLAFNASENVPDKKLK
jgi:hypothetical protein